MNATGFSECLRQGSHDFDDAGLCRRCSADRGPPPAQLPAELREAAGRAAFMAHAMGTLGRRGACDVCSEKHWTTLTEDERELFRVSQDPGLSVVVPMLTGHGRP